MILRDEYNVEIAKAALMEPFINTRICISIKPESEIHRFVIDIAEIEIEVDGNVFKPVPYAQISPITTGAGRGADTATITLDGVDIVSTGEASVDAVLQELQAYPLRDRPVQIGLIVLNTQTGVVIGLIPQFIGFVDSTPLTRSVDGKGVGSSKLEIKLASARGYFSRRTPRIYSDQDHQTRFSDDRACKHISDVVFRGGQYKWNEKITSGGGGRSPGNGGGGRFFNNHEQYR
ncbi:MAG: hypothetical protein COA43_11215 [Robiginitomaculum sp.]|nr:MAG: hypothetical protein COA43_11215 [Robiginitomaculum sp.]